MCVALRQCDERPANAGGAVPFALVAKIDDQHTGLEEYTPF